MSWKTPLLLLLLAFAAGQCDGVEDANGGVVGRHGAQDAVFGMACTYRRADMEIFVGSLRATGYDGIIKFGVDKALDDDTRHYLAVNGVTTDSLPCETVPLLTRAQREGRGLGRWLGGLNQARYTHYLRWLDERPLRWVWLLDVRDIVFLGNPFATAPAGLSLFSETNVTSPWVTWRVFACFGKPTARAMRAKEQSGVCAGTVYGTSDAIKRLSRAMLGAGEHMTPEGAAKQKCFINDQFLLAHLAWELGIHRPGKHVTKALGPVHLHGLLGGPVVTIRLAEVCARFLDTVGPRYPDDTSNGGVALVHKWDLCPTSRALAAARYPQLPIKTSALLKGSSLSSREAMQFARAVPPSFNATTDIKLA